MGVKMESSKLVCEECGNSMIIPRSRGRRRERGHVKHMYCFSCDTVTGFIEGTVTDSKVEFWNEWQNEVLGDDTYDVKQAEK